MDAANGNDKTSMINVDMLDVPAMKFKQMSTLNDKPKDMIKARCTMIIDFFKCWSRATKFINMSQIKQKGTLGYQIFNTKHLVIQ